ncbi:MAG: hypothetical protein LH472_05040 [Pyrinomonadaceae bacterium]|nr:hypothetical protein [Pyrinomonadaceae bacterium]
MIESRQIQEILKQYEKHGWNLRRVLLSAPTEKKLAAALFGEIEIIGADFDAVWFARPAANGGEAWELRSLAPAPFALVEVFGADEEESVREEFRRAMETQMKERASKPVAQKPSV